MKSLSLSKPHLIVMVGIPGSGKSYFAEKFAETFHTPYVSREKLNDLVGEAAPFIDDLLYYQVTELFKTRQSILIEGAGETRVERLEIAKWANKAGYETLLVWVQTDPATARSRYKKENKRASADEYEKRMQNFVAPIGVERPVVISGKHTYATQAKVVLKKLSEPRKETSTLAAPPDRTESAPRRRNIAIR